MIRDGRHDGLGNNTKVGGPQKKLKLRPEHANYRTGATAAAWDVHNDDAGSMHSGDSRLMIIKKSVGFTVKVETI